MFSESCNTATPEWGRGVSAGIKNHKTQAIHFSHQRRLFGTYLTLKGRLILFVINVKYLGVIFCIKNCMEKHTEVITAKSLVTFLRICLLLKIESLSVNTELSLYKTVIGFITACLPHMGIRG